MRGGEIADRSNRVANSSFPEGKNGCVGVDFGKNRSVRWVGRGYFISGDGGLPSPHPVVAKIERATANAALSKRHAQPLLKFVAA